MLKILSKTILFTSLICFIFLLSTKAQTKVSRIDSPSDENFSKVFFLNEKTGWLVGDGKNEFSIVTKSVYRTSDGGKTWRKLNLDIPKNSRINDIYFISEKIGWINIQSDQSHVPAKKYAETWIFKTDDGGENWTKQFNQKDLQLDKIIFTNEEYGWLIGEIIPRLPLDEESISKIPAKLYYTKNGGKTWNEVSKNYISQGNIGVKDIFVKSASNVFALNENKEIVETKDSGKTWEKISYEIDINVFPKRRFPKMELVQLINSQRFLAYDSFDSVETLSDGSIKPVWNYHIFESIDGGKSFDVIYKSSDGINSIKKLSANQFIAVGNNGLILKLGVLKSAK